MTDNEILEALGFRKSCGWYHGTYIQWYDKKGTDLVSASIAEGEIHLHFYDKDEMEEHEEMNYDGDCEPVSIVKLKVENQNRG